MTAEKEKEDGPVCTPTRISFSINESVPALNPTRRRFKLSARAVVIDASMAKLSQRLIEREKLKLNGSRGEMPVEP